MRYETEWPFGPRLQVQDEATSDPLKAIIKRIKAICQSYLTRMQVPHSRHFCGFLDIVLFQWQQLGIQSFAFNSLLTKTPFSTTTFTSPDLGSQL